MGAVVGILEIACPVVYVDDPPELAVVGDWSSHVIELFVLGDHCAVRVVVKSAVNWINAPSEYGFPELSFQPEKEYPVLWNVLEFKTITDATPDWLTMLPLVELFPSNEIL